MSILTPNQMQNHKINVKTNVTSFKESNYLSLDITWDFAGLEITWNSFDMEFKWFFDFLSKLEKNEKCALGPDNGDCSLFIHKANTDYCEIGFNVGPCAGNSTIGLKIDNKIMIEIINKICAEIKLFQEKHPNETSF